MYPFLKNLEKVLYLENPPNPHLPESTVQRVCYDIF